MEKKMTKEEELEQQRFIESFQHAMDRYESNVNAQRAEFRKKAGRSVEFKRIEIDRIKEAGNWNAEWTAGQYVLVVAKQSKLSSAEWKLIVYLGYLAKTWYDEHYAAEEKKDEKEEQS